MASEAFETDFWPEVKQHIRRRVTEEEIRPMKCHCPVCYDQMNVVGSANDANEALPRAGILPCGHMFCAACLDSLRQSRYQTCPTCRTQTQCQGCWRTVNPEPVPPRASSLKDIEYVRATASEGGEHGTHCMTCVQNRGWKNKIRVGDYPPGTSDFTVGFVPLVYNIMEVLDLNGFLTGKNSICSEFQQLVNEHMDSLIGHIRWDFRAQQGRWPPNLEAVVPGFAVFCLFHMNKPDWNRLVEVRGTPRHTMFIIFADLLGEHYELLREARDEHFEGERIWFAEEDVWFSDLP